MPQIITSPTRKKILNVAGRLFAKRGYFGVSMQDLADELHITKAALYYHFDSKETLTQILLRKSVDDLKKELSKASAKHPFPIDTLFDIVKTFLDFRVKHPELSLLASIGFSGDDRLPMVQFIENLRNELIKFVRDLISQINNIQHLTFKTLFTLATSMIGFVLSPFQYSNEDSDQLAKDFIALLSTGEKLEDKKVK
jgi:AcrR family transcriptional regulator